MADEPSLEAFISTLRRSRLFDAAELDRLAAKVNPATAREFADALVNGHELTHYQADKLLRGRWQGLVLGPYTVLAPLGRGGMGTVVYLARDRRASASLGDTELLALKLLPDRRAVADPKTLARFRREMDLGRRVNHPNVVHTIAAGDVEDVHYLALEFVPGRTVRQLVSEKGALSVGEAARIFAEVAAGLQHVHERGLIHRDVKPGNVMVRPDGRAVLLDLGLAFAPDDKVAADPAVVGGRGYVVGTMDYLAPEQARDPSAVGPAADIYGLGCSLYFALTGEAPFPAEGTKAKVRRHRNDPVPTVPDVPKGFAWIVRQMMAKKPDERPASADEVRELLLPWATAARATTILDALEVADAPGLDAGLWEAAPGDELTPRKLAESESIPFAQLEVDTGSTSESASTSANEEESEDASSATGEEVEKRVDPPETQVAWLILAALLTGALAFVFLIAVLRRL